MNNAQNKIVHGLLTSTGLMAEKANIVFGFTGGRSESSKELTDAQAKEMIDYLQRQKSLTPPEESFATGPSPQVERGEAANKMRRKMISIAYEMHWAKPGDWKTAVMAIDIFCTGPHGMFKKELKQHSYKELVQVVSQFELMYKKYLKKF